MKTGPSRVLRHLRRARKKPALLFALAMSLVTVCCNWGQKSDPHAQDPSAIPVKIEVAHEVPVSEVSEYVATLKSRESAAIMPQVEGWITKIYVHSGERVEAGSPLIEIDPTKQQATVKSQQDARAAQQANLKYAEEQYQRINGLYAAGVVSKQDLDQAKTALDAARAQLQSLEAQVREQQVQLHYYKVDAPRGGIVGDIPVRVGDRVTTTTTVTTLDRPGSLEAYIYVPIERSAQLKMGMPVELVDSEGQRLADSRVSFISPEVDNTTQTVLVKSMIPNNQVKLRTSQFIRARLIWGTHRGPVVPVLAVSRIGDQYFVFVAEPTKGGYVAHQRPLKIGQTVGNDYAVTEGIRPGDRVIVSGTQFLVDGTSVVPQS